MAETIIVETEIVENGAKRPPVMDVAQKSFRAGLGAFAVAQEEVASVFERLVERGEKAEEEGRKRFKELVEQRRKQAETKMSGAQTDLESSIERVLHRMNVPTKSDITALNEKVTLLTLKVEALLKETA